MTSRIRPTLRWRLGATGQDEAFVVAATGEGLGVAATATGAVDGIGAGIGGAHGLATTTARPTTIASPMTIAPRDERRATGPVST